MLNFTGVADPPDEQSELCRCCLFEGKGKTKIQRLFPSVHQQECALCCSSPLQRHGIANIWPPRSRDLPILEKISRTASAFPQLECKQTLVSCVGEVLHSPTMKKKRMPSTLWQKKRKSTSTPSKERVEETMAD